MTDSLKTYPKIKVYSSGTAQWKKSLDSELEKELAITEKLIVDHDDSLVEKHYWRGYRHTLMRVLEGQVPTRIKDVLEGKT